MPPQNDHDDDSGYKILIGSLHTGFQEANRIIEGFNEKAKSTITVSALVLGVMVAGTRVALGMSGEGAAARSLMEQAVPVVGIPASALMGAGIASIIVSIVASLVAIAAVRLDNPFGSSTVVTNGMLDATKIDTWNAASKKGIYRRLCKEYARAIMRRETVARWSGRATLVGQVALGAGVVLAAIASAGLFLA